MKKFLFIFFSILYYSFHPVYSQPSSITESADTTDLRKNSDEEILLENLQTDEDESKMLDFLDNLKRHPYDLNKVTIEQLETIPFLNSVMSKKIIAYRDEIKSFKTKRSLLKIEGMTNDLYEKIKIYLVAHQSKKDILIDETGRKQKVDKLYNKLNLKTRLRLRLLQELQPKEGYLNGKYEGTRPKIYNQLNSQLTNTNYKLEVNVTVEKDAGEKNLTDFVSGFIELKDYKFIKNVVAGDYTLNFGQGLAMWSSFSFSKGIEAVSPFKKRGKGIDGYSSVNEVQFFRGGAVKLNVKDFYINLFYSDNYFDATVDQSIDEVSSFYYDGYHRTTSEINRRNSIKEKLFGGRVSFEKGSLRLGATYWRSKFSKPVINDSSRQLYKFTGSGANMIGADYDFIFRNINFYGEFARSQSNSIAALSSMQITFFKFADIIFSYRNYPIDFTSLHSYGFGERSGDTYNEKGFYAGISVRLLKGLIINSYFDQFKFPYRTFSNPVSTSGNDFLTYIQWRAAKGFLINLKYKNENKELARTTIDEVGRDVKRIDNRNQVNARAGFIYEVTDRFRVRSRFEYVFVDYNNFGGSCKGHMFFSDIRIIPVLGLVVDTRFIFFDTDNYDSRIYEFESDIIGVMSNIPLYGKGRRWYLLMKYKPFPFMVIAAKYSETFLDGVKSIGSGNDKITGDINNRISVGFEIGF